METKRCEISEGKLSAIISQSIAKHISKPVKRNDKPLNEGLIKTYDIEIVKQMICRKYHLKGYQFSIRYKSLFNVDIAYPFIFLANNVSKKTINDVIHDMQVCGYNLACNVFHSFVHEIYDYAAVLQFEPSHSVDISKQLREKCRFLYHVTTESHLDKIKNVGLVPRSNNKWFLYPERVYCLTPLNGDSISTEQQTDIDQVMNTKHPNKTNIFDTNDFYLLTIDLAAVPDRVKFFIDPMFSEGGIYTKENIPPTAIIRITKVN